MSDFPGVVDHSSRGVITTADYCSQAAVVNHNTGGTMTGAAAWPAANRAIYCPVRVTKTCTVYRMGFVVTTQSGNYDIGIYFEDGRRLISKGSTAVPAAGWASTDITDTVLTPGIYFLALCIDNTTAAVEVATLITAETLRSCSVQQQAVGAVTLPDPATFANPASAYYPGISAHLRATV